MDNQQHRAHVLGLDIGSVSAGMVVLDQGANVVETRYRFHHGNIAETVREMLAGVHTREPAAVAATDQTPGFIRADHRCDDRVAVIEAARHLHGRVGSILHVGGEKFAMLFFENGRYKGLKTNTSCAAGTGSFLDQQAGRLKLSGIEELAATAAENRQEPPRIASRCAVFAKTDLIHAQQEGYSLAAICDGLCRGLAANIANTVFKHEQPAAPVIFCGGVARNQAVVEHMAAMLGSRPVVDDMAHLYGALGAAVQMLERRVPGSELLDAGSIICTGEESKPYGHPPLELFQSEYPEFASRESFKFHPEQTPGGDMVEVDIYQALEKNRTYQVYLGLDIGSTSTKAVWMSRDKTVLGGFYTRTAGRPVQAMQVLFEAMDHVARQKGVHLQVQAMGTTGSGRKFVGALAGADLVLDEITAHARAALELHPEVDTIIEIGGQDSKFTTLKNGEVTFSIMNTVCAAGTGSFIEEQAEKLEVPLQEYSDRTREVSSPIASDRCTVFMERDINYYLGRGYTVNEVLTAALHAVRENYLNKVAVESLIGEVICFQGATAKNRALVAAFEQRLDRPVHVSAFCHLTGALGVALHLLDEGVRQSGFQGLELYRQEIPVRSEVCGICTNHCKITVADMPAGPVAFGFLCGRDYETRHYVDNNLAGLDLARTHRSIFPAGNRVEGQDAVTVGIPTAVYMREDLSMWVDFFNRLGMAAITGDKAVQEGLKRGKPLTGAEFCAPMTALHGQAEALAGQADYIFLPYYLEHRDKDGESRRQLCYYSQYAPTLVASVGNNVRDKLISPVLKYLYSGLFQRMELFRAVSSMNQDKGFWEVVRAFENARTAREKARQKWRGTFNEHYSQARDISVMLLGRPYTVLDPELNKKIPQMFSRMGIKAFFQDMMKLEDQDDFDSRPFLEELHWNYAADIIKAAEKVCSMQGLYPVLMTSFNCSPDSFIRDVFQELMEGADKPYLILEMDEHGSSVGYETRIEAAVRSFKNHARRQQSRIPDPAKINPVKADGMSGRTVLFPNWDPITCRLLVANLRREGIDAHLLPEGEEVIKRSMRLNSGQCIPINAIAQEFVEHVRHEDLNPEKTVLWMAHAEIACNIRLYPYRLKQMISSFGRDMHRAGVYTGSITFADVSLNAAMHAYFAFMFGGMLRRLGCRIRPREKHTGSTDQALEKSLEIMEQAMLGSLDKEAAVRDVCRLFSGIETREKTTLQAAVFGDLYVRDNPVFNQDLIGCIESRGGEAITTPYTEYIRMIAPAYFRKWFAEGKYFNLIGNRAMLATMSRREKTFYSYFEKVLDEPRPEYNDPPEKVLPAYGLIPEQSGETMDNILKIHYILKHHPEVSLFVQTSPSFCCPSMVSEALAERVQEKTGVPIVSITYDGTGGDKNRKLIPYLEFAAADRAG